MLNWLNALPHRFYSAVWCTYQWLPALRFLALVAFFGTGLGMSAPGSQFPSLTGPKTTVKSAAGSSALLLTRSHHQNQSFGAGGDFARKSDQPSLAPSPVLSRIPGEISGFDSEDRKKVFIDVLLPTVMVALDEVRQERQQLLAIIAELGVDPADLSFAEGQLGWQYRLGGDKSKFILGLTRKYRTESAEELVAMVNVLPPSLVIAQGALESAWGASRFATEVNNLFGMYSSVDTPLSKSHGAAKGPKIMEYDSILESVRAYVLNINRLSAYKELRRIRCQTLDSMRIADGLTQYSERKEYYIADVKHIIARNNLQDYDSLIDESV